MKRIDQLLNSITMYRLTLYYLIALVVWAFLCSILGMIAYNPLHILASTVIITTISLLTNYIFAKICNAVTNVESVFITALILVLIIPVALPHNLVFMVAAPIFAMASKYLLTIEKRHIFNPAAVAVAYVSLLSENHAATWWVGTPMLFPVVLIGGLLVVRKVRREKMVATFLFVYLFATILGALLHSMTVSSALNALNLGLLHTALLFLAFVMLTEPLTSPATENFQILYAALVALLDSTLQLRLFSLAITPEFALLYGNIFSYFVSPKYRLLLKLQQKKQLTADTIEFSFEKVSGFNFKAGQYMEWTLPHKNYDNRGVRRFFSLASSPTEENPQILVKFYEPSSSYKKALRSLQVGGQVVAAQLSGDFTLPKNLKKQLVFIAGGVGIAPFRSMIQYIIDKKLAVDIVLLFSNKTEKEIVYADLFSSAELFGVRTIHILTDHEHTDSHWTGERGHVTTESLKRLVPDYTNRYFYISGPQLMVQGVEQTLIKSGVSQSVIKTDFFPGYIESK